HPPRAGGQPLPLHRLHEDRRRRRGVPGRAGGRRGGPAMTSTSAPTSVATGEYRVVGTSPAHHDFVEKVRGTLKYAADWRQPGMLHGRVVRSELPSARIVAIDTTKARDLDGVAAVLTAQDVPHNRIVEMASGGLVDLEIAM